MWARKGTTITEFLIAGIVYSLLSISVGTLMMVMAEEGVSSLGQLTDVTNQNIAINFLMRDVKSATGFSIDPDSQDTLMLSTDTSQGSLIYRYNEDTKQLMLNDEPLVDGVTAVKFEHSDGVISATIGIENEMPIRLLLTLPEFAEIEETPEPTPPGEVESSETGLTINGMELLSTVQTLDVPVLKMYEIDLQTSNELSRISYYTVNGGEKIEVLGSRIVFWTDTSLEPIELVVKVVAEDNINSQTYHVTLNPMTGDADPIPDWMWGGDESFRTFIRRTLGVSTLDGVTFGQVRGFNTVTTFNLTNYHVSELGQIISQFKELEVLVLADTNVTDLPEFFGVDMPNLRTLNLSGCELYKNGETRIEFWDNYNNSSWKLINCPQLSVVWPDGY